MGGFVDKVGDIAGSWVRSVGIDAGQDPAKREREKAGRKRDRAKLKARKELKVMPDSDTERTRGRKRAAKKSAARGGRTSTVLSQPDNTLGG